MNRIACLLTLSLLTPCTVLVLFSPTANAQQARTRIRLTGASIGGALPEGKAEIKEAGTKRSFRVEVKAALSLATERGQAVPRITPGTQVGVWTEAGGNIVAGTF